MRVINAIKTFFCRHGSKFLLIGGSIGTAIVTPIIVAKGWKKVRDKFGEDWNYLSKKTKAKETLKCIWPAIIIATVSVAGIIGGFGLTSKQLTMTTTALIGAESALESVISGGATEAGKVVIDAASGAITDISSDLKNGDQPVVAQPVESIPEKTCINTFVAGNADILCYDAWSGRPFMSTMNKIDAIINDMNDILNREDYVTLNEFYDMVHINDTDCGNDMGWDREHGLIRIKYDTDFDENGNVRLVLRFTEKPRYI